MNCVLNFFGIFPKLATNCQRFCSWKIPKISWRNLVFLKLSIFWMRLSKKEITVDISWVSSLAMNVIFYRHHCRVILMNWWLLLHITRVCTIKKMTKHIQRNQIFDTIQNYPDYQKIINPQTLVGWKITLRNSSKWDCSNIFSLQIPGKFLINILYIKP